MSDASLDHTIGSRLIQLRRKYNLTQSQLGEMCDVTKAAVSTWENGVAMPEIKKLLIVRSRLSFSFDWLIAGEGQMDRMETAADIPERRLKSRRNTLQHDRRQIDRRDSCRHDKRMDTSTRTAF